MRLPSVTGSSVALAAPNANSKKVQRAVLIISRSADKIEMFSEVEIEILYGVQATELTEVFCFFVCFVLFCFFDVALLP